MTVTSSFPRPASAPEGGQDDSAVGEARVALVLEMDAGGKGHRGDDDGKDNRQRRRALHGTTLFLRRPCGLRAFSIQDRSTSDGGARARVERDRTDAAVQNPYAADPRC